MAKTVISLCGYQGTGKTTLAKKIAHNLDTLHIETSDLVAESFRGVSRKDLTVSREKTFEDPNWLGKIIFNKIFPQFEELNVRSVVLSGVREVEVHKYLQKKQLKLAIIELIADPDVRYNRLLEVGSIRSTDHFITQDLKERQMGLDEVTGLAKFQIETTENTSPRKLAKAVIAKLTKEGYTLR